MAVTLLLVLAGAASYLRLQSPTPVSAAKVLHRAAAAVATPAAGDVVHEVMTYTDHFVTSPGQGVSSGSTYTNTVEQWSRFASDDTIDRFSLAWMVNGALVEHIVLNDQGYWSYDPKSKTVSKDPPFTMRLQPLPDGVIYPKTITNQPQNPATMRALLLNGANAPDTQLLPRQIIDGKPADVVRITRHNRVPPSTDKPQGLQPQTMVITLYIDASTYAVRRIDLQDIDTRGATVGTSTLQVTTNETLPASKVPAGTFTFTPPAGAQVRTCLATESCAPKPAAGSNVH